jgi:hypothetical protein
MAACGSHAVGQPDTSSRSRLKIPYNISVFGIAAGLAAIGNAAPAAERARNTSAVHDEFFEEMGASRRSRRATSSSWTSAGRRPSGPAPTRG